MINFFLPSAIYSLWFNKHNIFSLNTLCKLSTLCKNKIVFFLKQFFMEMQKASLPADIIRFRHYLGEQYTDPGNTISAPDGIKGLQIYCLYFLGKDLGIYDAPVLEVNSTVKDVATS
jgi:hypothetical protein